MAFSDSLDYDTRRIMSGEFSTEIVIEFDGISITLNGIFDRTYVEIDNETGVEVMSRNPRVSISELEFLENHVHGLPEEGLEDWFVYVNSEEFTIYRTERDGGMAVLYLKKRA